METKNMIEKLDDICKEFGNKLLDLQLEMCNKECLLKDKCPLKERMLAHMGYSRDYLTPKAIANMLPLLEHEILSHTMFHKATERR